MKLAEWCRMAGVLPTHPTTERGAVSLCWTPPNPPDSDSLAWDLHHLDDYKVSSRSGPVVWLVPVLPKAGSLVEYTPFGGVLTRGTFHGLAPGARWSTGDPFVSVAAGGRVVHVRLSILKFLSDGLPESAPARCATKGDPLGDIFYEVPELGGEG